MVEDIWFITVLSILIGFIAFFLIFMKWLSSKMPHPLMMSILSTLHASLFGYETALVELIGSRGYKSHVFPKIVETIQKIKDKDPAIRELFNSTTPLEAMQKWLELLKSTKVIIEGEIMQKSDNEFEISLPHCSMCNPIHEIMGDAKGICPMALIIAAASSIGEKQKQPEINYSKFFPMGTTTILTYTD